MSIPEGVIEAASIRRVEKHGFDAARARRVILALAENLPESAVDAAAKKIFAHRAPPHREWGDFAYEQSEYRCCARAAILAALKDIVEGE